MDKDKISIIIPVYNVIKYLKRAVDSVLIQNYTQLEIILIDDGSTDGSEILCDVFEQRDERVKVIHISNAGPAVARNTGLDIATGKYIYFMDSDDFLECNLFQTLFPFLHQDYDMIVFNYRKVDEVDRFLSQSNFETGVFDLEEVEQKARFILEKILKYRIGWEPWNRLYVREFIEKNHIRFGKENYAEDLCFFLCYVGCIRNILSLDKVLYNYRIRQNSLMDLNKKSPMENLNKVNNLSSQLKTFYESTDDCTKIREYYPVIHYFFLQQQINKLYDLGWPQTDIREFIRTGMNQSEACLKAYKRTVMEVKKYLRILDIHTLIKVWYTSKFYCGENTLFFKGVKKLLVIWRKIK